MSTYVSIGFSQNLNTPKAAYEAACQIKNSLEKSAINLVIILSTIHYNPSEISLVIRKTLSPEKIIGCSTTGIMLSDSIQMRGIAILAISSDEIHFGSSVLENIESKDIHFAGTILARNIIKDLGQHQRQAVFFFVDGLLENNSLLVNGILEVLGNAFPIIGAGSSDDFHFKKTYQYFQDKILSHSATGLLIGGHINIGIGSKHGWKPLGKPRYITKVTGHTIETIDGKKASLLYEEFLGEETRNLESASPGQLSILYPLGIYLENESSYLLRKTIDILGNGSIVCHGDVPVGGEIHIMIGNKDSCKQAAKAAALEIQESLLGKQPKLVIVAESLSRLKLLGRDAFQEIKMIKDVLGQDIPLIGMFSHGEIAPVQPLGHVRKPYFQNESIVLLAIG